MPHDDETPNREWVSGADVTGFGVQHDEHRVSHMIAVWRYTPEAARYELEMGPLLPWRGYRLPFQPEAPFSLERHDVRVPTVNHLAPVRRNTCRRSDREMWAMNPRTPLADLILTRMGDLGLTREELGGRLGYVNAAKAAGRLYALCDGNVPLSSKSRHVVRLLPEALEINADLVASAVVETDEILASEALKAEENRQRARDEEHAAWRASFIPHAILHTSRTVPTQIVACGMTGGTGRWLTIPFDLSRSPLTFVDQALASILPMTRENTEGRRSVMFFGEVLGFVVNYDPDRAVRFDLQGTPLEVLPKAYRPGEVVLSFGGRPVEPAVMARVLGYRPDRS